MKKIFEIIVIYLVLETKVFCLPLQDGAEESNLVSNKEIINNLIPLSHYGEKIYGNPNEENGEKLLENQNGNPEENSGYLEGDILIPKKKLSKNGLMDFSSKWDAGIIPFVITGPYDAQDLNLIYEAMKQYHDNTCVRFRRKQPEDYDYLNIVNTRTGCWSSVGRIGGAQEVNLQAPGCLTTLGTPVHELMHAVGFHHEQTRFERDYYVDIKWENIQQGHDYNFEKVPEDTAAGYGIPYDYASVMHYSAYAFSANRRPTIVPKTSAKIGQRDGFSVGDIRKIRRMYNCTMYDNVHDLNSNAASNNNNKNPFASFLNFLQNFITSFG